ncbi:hypothetical protein [Nocardia camponoti]|nr:hypothetical protein [Nocardia camponoti]
MPKDHARKNALAQLKREYEIRHHDAIALLDHPDGDERDTMLFYLASYEHITTYDEALAELHDPLNQTLCETCGWTLRMVCPECPGCGCYNGRCSGWRHREDMAATGDDDGLREMRSCAECGGDTEAYYGCDCD